MSLDVVCALVPILRRVLVKKPNRDISIFVVSPLPYIVRFKNVDLWSITALHSDDKWKTELYPEQPLCCAHGWIFWRVFQLAGKDA